MNLALVDPLRIVNASPYDIAEDLRIDHKTVSIHLKKLNIQKLDTWVTFELTERNLMNRAFTARKNRRFGFLLPTADEIQVRSREKTARIDQQKSISLQTKQLVIFTSYEHCHAPVSISPTEGQGFHPNHEVMQAVSHHVQPARIVGTADGSRYNASRAFRGMEADELEKIACHWLLFQIVQDHSLWSRKETSRGVGGEKRKLMFSGASVARNVTVSINLIPHMEPYRCDAMRSRLLRPPISNCLGRCNPTNAANMQSTRESCKPKRCAKRRNSRKKSLSPSDLKRARDSKSEKLGRRSLSEGSVKVKHRKSNIRRSLTHPFMRSDYPDVPLNQTVHSDVENTVKVQLESDESNLPPTSSDRDTEDDVRQRHLPKPRWDSGSEMDSIISIVRRVSARRRRTSQAARRRPIIVEWERRKAFAGAFGDSSLRYRALFFQSDSSRNLI
ncbi:hypothetical protein EVAR_21208_1 [Eumeta japonica]|uniref:Histone-lysine N-methyltransferase SETMAR n=1 Tax=Eumeta variegata TaxID=151549 RepID=A0A4C1UPV6_EUMVA|nr:hypothetical protein EVAR_21208_1 [Eumeta japonica]